MHLQQIKDASGKSWAQLQEACGVNRSMLWDVAQGWKWPGADTAPGLIKLGVSLDDQAEFFASRATARAARDTERRARSKAMRAPVESLAS